MAVEGCLLVHINHTAFGRFYPKLRKITLRIAHRGCRESNCPTVRELRREGHARSTASCRANNSYIGQCLHHRHKIICCRIGRTIAQHHHRLTPHHSPLFCRVIIIGIWLREIIMLGAILMTNSAGKDALRRKASHKGFNIRHRAPSIIADIEDKAIGRSKV